MRKVILGLAAALLAAATASAQPVVIPPAAGGGGGIGGTIAPTQVAFGTATDQIGGDAGFTFGDGQLTVIGDQAFTALYAATSVGGWAGGFEIYTPTDQGALWLYTENTGDRQTQRAMKIYAPGGSLADYTGIQIDDFATADVLGANRPIDYAGKFVVDASGNIKSAPLAGAGNLPACIAADGTLYKGSNTAGVLSCP